ncbi:MAG: fluoride efflux transporter CrcB [Bacteroidia bacterium]|jgi:CrcB protein
MPVWLWVALGGALGSLARFGVGQLMVHFFGERLTWGTLAVNLLGSFLAGLIWAWSIRGGQVDTALHAPAYAFGLIGFCGGFTTFSAFTRELFVLLQMGQFNQALLYIFMSIGLGIVGLWLGYRVLQL